jgi:hypothetical protein
MTRCQSSAVAVVKLVKAMVAASPFPISRRIGSFPSAVIPAKAGIQGERQAADHVALLEWTAPNGIDVPE